MNLMVKKVHIRRRNRLVASVCFVGKSYIHYRVVSFSTCSHRWSVINFLVPMCCAEPKIALSVLNISTMHPNTLYISFIDDFGVMLAGKVALFLSLASNVYCTLLVAWKAW